MTPDLGTARHVARALALDVMAAEVIVGLSARGVPSLLLKGPVLARTLYHDGAPRSYSDCDVLVQRWRLADAGAGLAALGFECAFDETQAAEIIDPHAQTWRRAGMPGPVDLHWRVNGVDADADLLWSELSSEAQTMTLAGTSVTVPGRSRIAFLVALHAAGHGRTIPKPLADLERALARFDLPVWEEAGRVAVRLEATDYFVAGLQLLPIGSDLANRLGMRTTIGPELALALQGAPRGSLGLTRVLDTPGLRGKARVLRARLLPSAAYMRFESRLARRGPVGLLAAYALKTVTLAWHAPGAARAALAARRRA